MANPYARSLYLYPVTIDADSNGVVLTETGSGTTFTINADAADYWPHNDPSHDSDYPALYKEILDKLGAEATANTYTFENATPTLSPSQLWSGLALVGDTGAFTLDFSDPNFTLDPRLLGFPADQSVDVASVARGTDAVVYSSYQAFSFWRTVNRIGNRASRKRSDGYLDVRDSAGRAASRVVQDWGEQEVRSFLIEFIRAAHIHVNAALEDDWAEAGQVATGDNHNAFYYLYRAFVRNHEVIAVHNIGANEWDLQLAGHSSEVLKRYESWPTRFAEFVTNVRDAGETYSVSFDCEIVASNLPGYKH